MCGPGEHVYGGGGLGIVAHGLEAGGVAGKGGAVAGDIYYTLRAHGGDGRDGVLAHAFPGRVNHYCVGVRAACGEAFRGLCGVGTDEFHVADPVGGGVGAGVFHGLGDYLRADDMPGPLRKTEADSTRTAVELQHCAARLRQSQLDRAPVQQLGLRRVDLVESLGGDLKAEAGQHVREPGPAPKRVKITGQHCVAARAVDAEHNARQARARCPQRLNQRPGPVSEPGGRHHAAHGGAVPRRTCEDMPDGAGAFGDVVRRNPVFRHPADDVPGTGVRLTALQQAVVNRHYVMASGAEKTADRFRCAPADGKNGLVPVAFCRAGADDAVHAQLQAADAPEGVVYLAALELQLARIAHVHRRASAAASVSGTGRSNAVRGGGEALLSAPIGD